MEELDIQKNEIEEKEKGGFWKGFFCAAILFVVIGAVALGIGVFVKVRTYPDSTRGLVTKNQEVQSKLEMLEMYIRGYYLDEIDDDQMEDYLYYGLVAGLGDPYAAYYNEEETQSMLDSSSGNYCGIGAVFSQNLMTGVITVTRVYEGCPSYEAGILPEDILYMVEGEEITGQDLTNVVTKIKGEEGTEVTITMLRGEKTIDFTMKRQMIEVPTIEHEMLADHVGYILITEFDGVTDEQFGEALDELETQGMKSLVIDLRNNAFGRWISSYAMLSYAVYFVHIMLINFWCDLLSESLAHVYYQIPIITLCSFLSSYAVVWILSKLPKAKVWLGS